MITAEQVIAAQKSNLETMFAFGAKAFEGIEKLVELNVQVAKASMGEMQDSAMAAMSVKDPQAFMAMQTSMMQPATEKLAAYSRHLYDISQGTSAEIGKLAEAQMSGAQQKFMSMIDGAVQNAPAGTENAVAMVKAAVTQANSAYESVSKAAKQATDAAEANFTAMTNTAVKASTAVVSKVRKVA